MTNRTEFKALEIRRLKEGDYFRRKPEAQKEFIRNHYNRKDAFGPANYCCTAADDIGRESFLKPATGVYVEV